MGLRSRHRSDLGGIVCRATLPQRLYRTIGPGEGDTRIVGGDPLGLIRLRGSGAWFLRLEPLPVVGGSCGHDPLRPPVGMPLEMSSGVREVVSGVVCPWWCGQGAVDPAGDVPRGTAQVGEGGLGP
jgi:hypothetical protein